jgi:hypothetical protein
MIMHASLADNRQVRKFFEGELRAGSDFDTLALSGMPHGRCGHCLSSNRIPYPGDTSTTATVIQQRTQRLRAARSETATNGGFRNGKVMKMDPSVTFEQAAPETKIPDTELTRLW